MKILKHVKKTGEYCHNMVLGKHFSEHNNYKILKLQISSKFKTSALQKPLLRK